MKLLRPILISIGVIGIFGGILVGLGLNSSFQRWAVLRTAAKHPDLHLKFDSISAGFWNLTARGVQFEHRGRKISFDRLEAEYSLWAYLSGRRLHIRRVNVQALLVDASQVSSRITQAGIAVAPAAATGALAQVRLPREFVLDELDVEGRVLLAGAAGPSAIQGAFNINGGWIGPDREGELHLKAQLTDSTPGARVTVLDAQTTVQLRESPQRTFDHIAVTSLLDASGPGLSGKNQLKLVVEMNRAPAGEKYRVAVDTLRGAQSENVLTLDAAPTAQSGGARSYVGEWALSASSAQLEPFMLGWALPKFMANGSGRFTFDSATTGVILEGNLRGEASEFEKLRPELRAVGTVQLKSDFALEADPGVIRFKKSNINLAGERPVLDLRTSDSLVFNIRQRRFESGGAASGEILSLALAGLPCAWVAPFCSGTDISGGTITGVISLLQGKEGQISLHTSAPLQADGVTVARAGRTLLAKTALKIDADAELSDSRAQVNFRGLTLKTAAGDTMQAKAVLTAPLDTPHPSVAVTGEFSADLPALLVPLLPAGPLKARGSVDFVWQEDRVEVRRLSVESSDAKGNLLASLTATRAFGLDLVLGRAETGEPKEVALANIKFGQLPLVAFPKLFSAFSASGRLGPAEAVLSAMDGKLILRAIAPVPIVDFSVSQGKKPVLDRLKLLLQPVVEFNDGVFVRMQSGEVSLRTGADLPLALLNGELTQSDTGLRAVSSFEFDLPAWSSQPALLGSDALSSGQAKGELRAAMIGEAMQIEARATVNSMITSESGQTLPVANLSVRADIDANGHISVQLPVLLDRAGQRSDLNFSVEGAILPKGLSFNAKLTSQHIELRDMLFLLAVAGSPLGGDGAESSAAQSRALSPPSADPVAFWSGTSGQLTIDCQSVVHGPEWTWTGLTGRLVVNEDEIVLEKLDATVDEKSRFAAKGALTFAQDLNPYRLTGDFSLSEFDTGRYFKTLNAERAPVLEGLFAIKGELEGLGLNFDDTIDRTRVAYDFTSRQGIFRGLKRPSDKLPMVSKAVVLVSSLLGDKSAEKLTGNAYYIEQLAQELEEIHFDQFTVRLLRDPLFNLKLENITLISQQLHFLGSGQVTVADGKPLLEQPLEATLSLRGRDKIEEILGKLKVLEGTRDKLGYAKSKEAFTVGGTLTNPDPMAFFAHLAASKPSELPPSPVPEK